jgi:hypothetical protein
MPYINGASEALPGTLSSCPVTLPFAQSAGQTLVVATAYSGTALSNLASVTDTAGNTYIRLPATGCVNSFEPAAQILFVAFNIASALANDNTVTLNLSPASATPSIAVLLYTGSTLVDASNSVGEPSSSPMDVSLTTQFANEELIGIANMNAGDAGTFGPGAGFAAQFADPNGIFFSADALAASAGPQTWTPTATSPGSASVMFIALATPDILIPADPIFFSTDF